MDDVIDRTRLVLGVGAAAAVGVLIWVLSDDALLGGAVALAAAVAITAGLIGSPEQ